MHRSPHEIPRLLYVINDLAVGGAQRVLVSQAKGLDRTRLDVEVASLELVPEGPLIKELVSHGITVHRLLSPGEPVPLAFTRLVSLMKEWRPDLIHTHLVAAGVMARAAAHVAGSGRLLVTLHNLRDWEEKRFHPLRWLDRRTIARCDRVVAVSDAIHQAVTRLIPRVASRVRTVRNGVDLRRIEGAERLRPKARLRLGYGTSAFVVGSVARLEACKGLDVLIEAAARVAPACPDLRVLLVGDGPERKHLEALARRGGIGDRVHFTGSSGEIREYLAAMDLFAAPSRTEGLGLAILESMAAGVPALGSRVGGIPEAIDEGSCGELLPPERPDIWSERILHYARHREELIPMAESARRHAAAFSLDASCRELHAFYAELLGSGAEEWKAAA
jgi:glycosyltransferase involved in cell wall biosynthesis